MLRAELESGNAPRRVEERISVRNRTGMAAQRPFVERYQATKRARPVFTSVAGA